MLTLYSLLSLSNNSLTCFIPTGSKPFIGSSNINNLGLPNNANAIARRCFIPKEYSFIFFSSIPFNPTISNKLGMSFLLKFEIKIPCATRFSTLFIFGYNAGSSINEPISCLPFSKLEELNNKIFPFVGYNIPHNNFINVVFPAPFFPTSPYIMPSEIFKLILFKTLFFPIFLFTSII